MKYEELKDEIKDAMKAHDNVRRDILRQVHGEIKNIEVNERREVTDADVDAMLKRVIKQTSETLEGSIKAANNDERTAMLKEQETQQRLKQAMRQPNKRKLDKNW